MDIQSIIEILNTVAPDFDVATLLVGIATTGLVEGAKRLKSVKIDPKNTKSVRGLAAVFVFIGTVLFAWADGTLGSGQFTQYLSVAATGLVSYLVAYLGYESVVKVKKTEEYTG